MNSSLRRSEAREQHTDRADGVREGRECDGVSFANTRLILDVSAGVVAAVVAEYDARGRVGVGPGREGKVRTSGASSAKGALSSESDSSLKIILGRLGLDAMSYVEYGARLRPICSC